MDKKLLVSIISFLLISIVLSGCLGEKVGHLVDYVYISPNGEYIISDDSRSIQFWDVSTQKELTFDTDEEGYYCWSPTGQYIANNGKIREFPSMAVVANFSGYFFDWSANGEIFVSMGDLNETYSNELKTIELFNTTDFSIIKTIFMNDRSNVIYRIKVSPDGTKILYYSTSSNSLKVIDTRSENITLLCDFDDIKHPCDVKGIDGFRLWFSWSSDGDYIGIATHYDLQCWNNFLINSQNGTLIYNSTIMSDLYSSGRVDFSPDCNKISYCDSHVEIWNLSNGETIKVISDDTCTSIDWSLNGGKIATGGDGIIKVYDTQTSELLASMKTKVYQTPGFEIIIIICAIALILFRKQKRKIS